MKDLNQNHQRTLILKFRYPAEAADFAARVKNAALHENQVTLQTSGAMDPILKLAARYEVVDLETRRQTLEDLFLHYYGKEHTA